MKAVLFDMDGVLVDSETYFMQGTYTWLKEKGYRGTFEEVCSIVGTSMKTTYEMLQKMLDYKYSIDEIEQFNTEYFSNNEVDYSTIIMPYSIELMKFLKDNNIKMALCSSSPQKLIDKAVRQCGFDKYLDYIISGDSLKESKPNPEIYLKAASILNVDIKDCFIIEDSKLGIQAGKNAGIKTIALKDERFSQDQSKADYIFSSLHDIKNFLATNLDK